MSHLQSKYFSKNVADAIYNVNTYDYILNNASYLIGAYYLEVPRVAAGFASIMSEEATIEPGALEKKIIRQVEFYFGDRNLRRDKFLLEQVKKDDGCIQLFISSPRYV